MTVGYERPRAHSRDETAGQSHFYCQHGVDSLEVESSSAATILRICEQNSAELEAKHTGASSDAADSSNQLWHL